LPSSTGKKDRRWRSFQRQRRKSWPQSRPRVG